MTDEWSEWEKQDKYLLESQKMFEWNTPAANRLLAKRKEKFARSGGG